MQAKYYWDPRKGSDSSDVEGDVTDRVPRSLLKSAPNGWSIFFLVLNNRDNKM